MKGNAPTASAIRAPAMLPQCSLNAPSILPQFSRNAPSMLPQCSRNAPSMLYSMLHATWYTTCYIPHALCCAICYAKWYCFAVSIFETLPGEVGYTLHLKLTKNGGSSVRLSGLPSPVLNHTSLKSSDAGMTWTSSKKNNQMNLIFNWMIHGKQTLPEFASMSTKQWLQVEVLNEIVMYLLLSLISNLDFKLLFMPIEASSGSVYWSKFRKCLLKQVREVYISDTM